MNDPQPFVEESTQADVVVADEPSGELFRPRVWATMDPHTRTVLSYRITYERLAAVATH